MIPSFHAEASLGASSRSYRTGRATRTGVATVVAAADEMMAADDGGDAADKVKCVCPCCLEVAGKLICC